MIPLVAPHYTPHDRKTIQVLAILEGYDDTSVVEAFEEEFAAYVGCRGGVAVNSGTNALKVVLQALNIYWPVVPSFSCRALMDAADGNVLLCDGTFDIPSATAEFQPVGTGNGSFVLPHMFGTPSTWVKNVAGAFVHTVVDMTLSLGTVRIPQIGVCSFYRDKMISTGRGGMIVSQDQAFLDRCRELAYYDQPRNGGYRPAFSFGMTAMQAALGRSQLRQLPTFIERRREIASRYTQAFTEAGIECPNQDVDSVFFRYIVGTTDPADKVARLGEVGIEAGRGVNPPLHRLLGLDPDQFPGAEECFSKLLSVPVHPSLTDEQVGYITEQVIEVCGV